MIAFRHCDPRFPFLHGGADQPPGRWHGTGQGPVHYLADTPDGAWAEFLRHEEIREEGDLVGVERDIWAVEIADPPTVTPELPPDVLAGDRDTYPRCQGEAQRLRDAGATGLLAPSAALERDAACGWKVDAGLHPGPARNGRVLVLFGPRPDIIGWRASAEGRPARDVLEKVRHFGADGEGKPPR
jgi:hypothetical protein